MLSEFAGAEFMMMIQGKEVRGLGLRIYLRNPLQIDFMYTCTSEERTENDGYRDICTLSVNPDWCCILFSSCLPVFIGMQLTLTLRDIFQKKKKEIFSYLVSVIY